jgi:hypothetical protein
MKTLRLSVAVLTLLAVGTLAGCSGTAASPDVSDHIRKSLDQAGFVSVSQNRDKGIVTPHGKRDRHQLMTTLAGGGFGGGGG